jgi:LysM repeat protein
MRQVRRVRFFDGSAIFILGLVTLLFISLPGGCGDSESDDEIVETTDDVAAEPTAPPMMEIVDPDPDNVIPEGESAPTEGVVDNEDDDADQSETVPEPATPGTYVVQPGDTLFGIAVQHNVSMDRLMEANGLSDPNQLQVGQELQIPNDN